MGRDGSEWSQLWPRSVVVLRISGGSDFAYRRRVLISLVMVFAIRLTESSGMKAVMTQPVLTHSGAPSCIEFPIFNGDVHALNNDPCRVNRSEIVGLVGRIRLSKSSHRNADYASATDGAGGLHQGADFTAGRRCSLANAREKQLRQWRRTSGDDLSGTDDRPSIRHVE